VFVLDNRFLNERILVVDDDEYFRSSIVDFLSLREYMVDGAASAAEARQFFKEYSYSLVFADIIMPEENGIQLLHWIKKNHQHINVVMISGTGFINDVIDCVKNGAYDYIQKPLVNIAHIELVLRRALEQRQLDLDNEQLCEKLREQNINLERIVGERTEAIQFAYTRLLEKNQKLKNNKGKMEEIYLNIISFISDTMEHKDGYTAGHSERVRRLALLIAERMGKKEDELILIGRAAKLHDVGKLVIDLEFINKPGPLSQDEWKIFKKHPVTGAELLRALDFLNDEAELILHHHERYDGSGYPEGKKTDETPFNAYIIALADALDAMLSVRSYKKSITLDEAVKRIKKGRGRQFHAEAVDVLLDIIKNSRASIIDIMKEEY